MVTRIDPLPVSPSDAQTDTSEPSVPRDSTSLGDVRWETGYDVLGFYQFGDTAASVAATGCLFNLLRSNARNEAVNNMENQRVEVPALLLGAGTRSEDRDT